MNLIIGFILGGLGSWIAIKALIPILTKLGFIDIPNERSSHDRPKPRAGGIAIIIGVAIAVVWFYFRSDMDLPWWFWATSFTIAALGITDDKVGLPVWFRLFVQAISIALVIHFEGWITHFPLPAPFNFELGEWGVVLSFIWVLAIMNIFNFLDGIDGLAGVQTLIAAAGLSLFFSGTAISLFMIALSGASLGFLFWNWDPSKVFMGDVGSSLIGFWFAIAPFYVQHIPIDQSIFIVVIGLWVFISDGVFTILRRARKKEKIWKPHRSHLYQRLNIAGWRHRKIVSLLIIHMVLVISGLSMVHGLELGAIGDWGIFLVGLISFMVYVLFVIQVERNSEVA